MKSKMDTKICGVCGDKALGHNFNAMTCESCKAFFRRNALTQKSFKCPFNNQCEITTITRRFCQKCRLDKCFTIGMCKDLIMSEEDKVAKRQKIQENRVKRQYHHGSKNFKSFKKMKKENSEVDSQESEYGSTYNTDSDSKDTTFSEQSYQPNNTTNVGVTNQSDMVFIRNITEEGILSPTERLVTSSDDISVTNSVLSPQEFTLIGQNSSESETICTLSNNNDLNCSNSAINQHNQTNSRENIDYITQDVLNDVERYDMGF